MDDGEICDLALLISVVAAVDGIERIRFTTSHPIEFGDRLIQAYADVPELAAFLHLPVQSGSDRILTAMKRGHTAIVCPRFMAVKIRSDPDCTGRCKNAASSGTSAYA